MSRPSVIGSRDLDDILAAARDLDELELPINEADIASALGVSRRSLGRLVFRETGLDWPQFRRDWVLPVLPTWGQDDEGMKSLLVPLTDDVFAKLRRVALAELRDPRLEARRILETALNDERGTIVDVTLARTEAPQPSPEQAA